MSERVSATCSIDSGRSRSEGSSLRQCEINVSKDSLALGLVSRTEVQALTTEAGQITEKPALLCG